jgi:hypothetical protein
MDGEGGGEVLGLGLKGKRRRSGSG